MKKKEGAERKVKEFTATHYRNMTVIDSEYKTFSDTSDFKGSQRHECIEINTLNALWPEGMQSLKGKTTAHLGRKGCKRKKDHARFSALPWKGSSPHGK